MNRFLIFDNYGACKADTADLFADGAAHEIDAVREMLIRARRFPVRFDRRDENEFGPEGYSECFVVYSVPPDSPIDTYELDFYENAEYIARRGGKMAALVFVFDNLEN